MRKVISVLISVTLAVCFCGCNEDVNSNGLDNSYEKLECSMCGQMNSIDSNFCSDCGEVLKTYIETPESFYEDPGLVVDSYESYSLLSYFKSISDKPLIIYSIYDIAKDEEVRSAYVIKDGKCRKYYCSITLGELSKMTDEQILEMLEDYYQDGLSDVLSTWKSDYDTANAIFEGKVKLYEPCSYEIEGCLFTDSTGNSVVGELLYFPVAGIDDTPYVIEYPQYTDHDKQFMNYYGMFYDSSSYRDIKFKIEYFNTGYGTKSDINQVNDMYYVTNNSVTTGVVYDSNYYGLKSYESEWCENTRTLCFRVDNPRYFVLNLDVMSSSDVSYVDPTENNVLQICKSYYYSYYSSFKTLE